jgi:hypothetical protein
VSRSPILCGSIVDVPPFQLDLDREHVRSKRGGSTPNAEAHTRVRDDASDQQSQRSAGWPCTSPDFAFSVTDGLADFPRNFILSPFTASQPPLSAELAARFPEWSAGEIELLMKDHEDEIAVLERYIGEAGLEERVKEVAELVRRDVEVGWEEDVQM